MRTKTGDGARFYIGSASPKDIVRGKEVSLTTGRAIILHPLLAEKIMRMKLGKKGRREISGESFGVTKQRLETPACGKFTVLNFFVPRSVFYKYKNQMKALLYLGEKLHE